MTDPVTVGSAVVAYIEPAAGEAAAFNAWYERDHFYAAAMAGPGMYAGARWVATRACKDARLPGRLFGDPARGSYLATYWLLPGAQAEWDDWAARVRTRRRRGSGSSRVGSTCTPRSYGCDWDLRAGRAPAPAAALDRGFPGVVAIATTGDAREWADDLVGPDLPLVVGFGPQRVIMSSTNPGPHTLVLAFCTGDPLAASGRVSRPFSRTGPTSASRARSSVPSRERTPMSTSCERARL